MGRKELVGCAKPYNRFYSSKTRMTGIASWILSGARGLILKSVGILIDTILRFSCYLDVNLVSSTRLHQSVGRCMMHIVPSRCLTLSVLVSYKCIL